MRITAAIIRRKSTSTTAELKRVVDQLMDGTYSHGDHEYVQESVQFTAEYAEYR